MAAKEGVGWAVAEGCGVLLGMSVEEGDGVGVSVVVGVMDGKTRVVGVGAGRRVAIIPSRITLVNPVK